MEKHGATAPPQSEVEIKAEWRTSTRTVKAEEECQEAIEYVIKRNVSIFWCILRFEFSRIMVVEFHIISSSICSRNC